MGHKQRRHKPDRPGQAEASPVPDSSPASPAHEMAQVAVNFLNNHLGRIGLMDRHEDDEAWQGRRDSILEATPEEVRGSLIVAMKAAADHLKRSFDR